MEYLSAIIGAIGSILMGYFTYNQYTKDKMTDLKIEQLKAETERKAKRRSDSSAIVYGELWQVLHELNADRVYIIQPHPLGNESMLSVYYEVKRKGVMGMKADIQDLKMCDVAKFSESLAKNLFQYITNIEEQVADKYAQAILSSHGTYGVIIKRLNDNRHDWVGSVCCEFTHPIDAEITEEHARETLHTCATAIQFLLPEFKD